MFRALSQLIARWRNRRRLAKRQLFPFHDGQRWRFIDPFRAWREIQNHPTYNFEVEMPAVDAGEKQATDGCIDALCGVFGCEKWDEQTGRGLTDSEVLGVYLALIEYLDELKKSISPGPIESPPSASESSTSPAPPGEAGNASPESASISSESSCDAPPECSPESKAP